MKIRLSAVALYLAVAASSSSEAAAQSGGSPSFQPPSVTVRELNFGISRLEHGLASLIFQWREGVTPRLQFGFDVGLSDGKGRSVDNQLVVGGSLGWELARESADVPLDFLLTGGVFLGAGDYGVLRIPVGLSVGHTFLLDGNLSLTPYAHPRLAIESCKGCSVLAVDFDVGGNLQLSRTLALRVSGVFGSSDAAGSDGFGISLAWTPPGLRK